MEDDNTDFKEGDKVKDYSNPDWEQPYARAVVTNTNPEEGDIEIMPLEQKEKGEQVTRELDDIGELKQSVYLCMAGRSYGTSKNKEIALRNCLQAFSISEDREEPIKVWMAEVDQNDWSIRGMGSVYSTFIDNQQEFEVKPDLAREISKRAEDTSSLSYSALDEEEPYREGLNYRVTENTVY